MIKRLWLRILPGAGLYFSSIFAWLDLKGENTHCLIILWHIAKLSCQLSTYQYSFWTPLKNKHKQLGARGLKLIIVLCDRQTQYWNFKCKNFSIFCFDRFRWKMTKAYSRKKSFILSLKMLWTHFILDLIHHFVGTVADPTPSNQVITGSEVQIHRDLFASFSLLFYSLTGSLWRCNTSRLSLQKWLAVQQGLMC